MAEDNKNNQNSSAENYSDSAAKQREQVASSQAASTGKDGIDYSDDQTKRSVVSNVQKAKAKEDATATPGSADKFDASDLNYEPVDGENDAKLKMYDDLLSQSTSAADNDFIEEIDFNVPPKDVRHIFEADNAEDSAYTRQSQEAKQYLPNDDEINEMIANDLADNGSAEIEAELKAERDNYDPFTDNGTKSATDRTPVDKQSFQDKVAQRLSESPFDTNAKPHEFPGNLRALEMPEANTEKRETKLNQLFDKIGNDQDYDKAEELGVGARDGDEFDTIERFPEDAGDIYKAIYEENLAKQSFSINGIQSDKDGNLYALTKPDNNSNEETRGSFKIDKADWDKIAEATGLGEAGVSADDLANHPNTRVEFNQLPFAQENDFNSVNVASKYDVDKDGTVKFNFDKVDNDLLLPAVDVSGYNPVGDFELKSIEDLRLSDDAKGKANYEKPIAGSSTHLDAGVQSHIKDDAGTATNIETAQQYELDAKAQFPDGESTVTTDEAENTVLESIKHVSITGVQRGQDGQLYALTQPERKDGKDARGAFAISDKSWDSLMKATGLNEYSTQLESQYLKEPSTRVELGETGVGRVEGFDKINIDFKPVVSPVGEVKFNAEPDSSNVSFGKTQYDGSESTKSVDDVKINPASEYANNEVRDAYQGNSLVLDKQIVRSVNESSTSINQVVDTMNDFEFHADQELAPKWQSAQKGYNTEPFHAWDYDLRTIQNRDSQFADGPASVAISQIDRNDSENPRFTLHLKDAMAPGDYDETTVKADDFQLHKLLELNGRTNEAEALTNESKTLLANDQRLYAKVDVKDGQADLDTARDVLDPDVPDGIDDYTDLDKAGKEVNAEANPKLVTRIQNVKRQRQFLKDLNSGKIEGVSNSKDATPSTKSNPNNQAKNEKKDNSKNDDGPDL